MTYYTGNTISSTNFMDFRGPIGPASPYPDDDTAAQGPLAAIIGYGYGTRGYGQLDTFLPPRNPGNRVSSVEWNAIQSVMNTINIHTGSALTLQPRVSPNGRIIAEDGVDSTANIEALVNTLDINRSQFDPDQMSSNIAITSARDQKWNGTITHEFVVDFDSEDHARWYFNSGGSIDISGSRYDGTISGSTVVVAPFLSPRVYPVTWPTWSSFMNTYGVWVDRIEITNPVCIAVIDEASPSAATIQNAYNTLRTRYPNYKLYLLQPGALNPNALKLPSNWGDTGLDFGPIAVNRDNGNAANRSDWYSICNLDQLPPNSVIGIFIDNSGSMTTGTVRASYDYLLTRLAEKKITHITSTVGNEIWPQPFVNMKLTTNPGTPDRAGKLQTYYRNFTAPYDGRYLISIQGDNMITLYVDGVKEAQSSSFDGRPNQYYAYMTAGNHVLRFEVMNNEFDSRSERTWSTNPGGWAVTIRHAYWSSDTALEAETVTVDGNPIVSPAVYKLQDVPGWSSWLNNYSVWVNPGTNILKNQPQTIYRNFNAPATGNYVFYIAADDRIKVSVDGVEKANVYRNFNDATPGSITVNMTAGNHVLKFEALNDGSGNSWSNNPGGWGVLITSGILWDTRSGAAEDYVVDTSFTSPTVYAVSSTAGDWNKFMNDYAVWVRPVAESVVDVTQTRHRMLTIPYTDTYTIDYAVDDNMTVFLDERKIIVAGVTTSRASNIFGTKKLKIDQGLYTLRVDAYNNPVRGGWAIRIKDSTGKVIWTTRTSLAAENIPGPNGPNVTIYTDGTSNAKMSNLFVNAGTVSIAASSAVVTNSGSGYGDLNAAAGYYNLNTEYTPVYSYYTAPGATTVSILKETYAAPSVSYTYVVPLDTTKLTFKLWGAGGAGGPMFAPGLAYPGGAGAFVQGTVPVTPGEILTVKVGGGGAPGISVNKAWDDTYGGGGGGWSGVFRGEQPLLIAAGGGGSPANFHDNNQGTVIWDTRNALAAETVVFPTFTSPATYALNTVPSWSTFMNNNSVWVNPGTGVLKDQTQTIVRNFNAAATGTYKFSIAADDRIKVYLDNVEVANVYRNFNAAATVVNSNITAGSHILKFEALNDGNGTTWAANPGGWAVRIDNSSNATVWSTRTSLDAEQITPPPIASPRVYSVSNTAWSEFMNEYAVWPVDSSSIPAPTNYTIYRNFTAPVSGNYIFRYAADNKMVLKIDSVTIGTVESFTGNAKETVFALSQGLHILEFVVTNNNNPSPAGYAVAILQPVPGGWGGAGGIAQGSDSQLGNGAFDANGGTQDAGGIGGIADSPSYNGENGVFLQGGAGGNKDVKNRNWYTRRPYQSASVYPIGINGGVNGGGQGGAGGSGGGGGGYFGGGGGSAIDVTSISTSGGGAGGSSYISPLATNVITLVSTDGFAAPNRNDPDYRTGVAAGGAGGVTVGDLGKAGGSGLVAIYQANAITPINSENWIVEAKVERISKKYGGNGSRLRIKSSISSNVFVDNSGVVSTAKPAYVTVIDESSQTVTTMENSYQLFRSLYPQHRLYLLWPRNGDQSISVLKIPPSWGSNPNDFGPIQVRRDNNNVNLRDNWFNICNLQDLPGGSQIGIFLDTSGSLAGDVKASYDLFVNTLASKNILQQTAKNSNENWISPLLDLKSVVPTVKPVVKENIVDGVTESIVKRTKAVGVLNIAEPKFSTVIPLTDGGVQEPPRETYKVNPTCIAVIDEVSPTPATIQASYDKFRKNCPDSYLYLLQPKKSSQSTIQTPNGWGEIAGDFGPIVVNRDNNDRNLISDWYALATLDRLPDNSTVQLFIDNSGSMTTNTVQASYNHFKSRCQERGIKIILYTNKQENWIAPFKCGAALIVEDTVDSDIPPAPPPPLPTPPTSEPPKPITLPITPGAPTIGSGGGGSDKTTNFVGNNGEVYSTRDQAVTYGGGVKGTTTGSVTSVNNKSVQGGSNFGTVTAVSNTNKSNPTGGYSSSSSTSNSGGGCCFIMLEARYGDGTMDTVVRRYRDEYMTERNRRGYYKVAEVFVPLMRKSKLFKWVVTKTMADPLVAYGKYYYGENSWGWIFRPVKNFWMTVFDTVGGDTKFIRENGEEI